MHSIMLTFALLALSFVQIAAQEQNNTCLATNECTGLPIQIFVEPVFSPTARSMLDEALVGTVQIPNDHSMASADFPVYSPKSGAEVMGSTVLTADSPVRFPLLSFHGDIGMF
mmetsp:Transcript_6193/g.19880  ORF Transcript_6193/g.19880 Transcript_6193/m.19880 type:complete len:113 (-) Transcript_6193:170-508(-)